MYFRQSSRQFNITATLLLISFLPKFLFAEEHTFTLPEGYEIVPAATAPLVSHPVMAGFDDQGRLYVAENAGVNLEKAELEKQLPSSILRLEDKDGDGVFDTRTVFADKLTFPQGAVWYRGSVYVASSGSIWKFTDKDDDGVAEVREQLVNKFGYTGNAADIHGCFIGPEGRIYWCEGRHGHEFRTPSGVLVSNGKAARIFSCWPDGSDVQTHCGGGMDNPVEIDWTAGGDMLGTVNIFYEKRGDCLVHWMRGGVYPRNDQPDVIAEFRRTGPLLDAVYDFGHVAVSGMTRLKNDTNLLPVDPAKPEASAISEEFLITQFNTHKVVRCRLTPDGSTYAAQEEDFLVGTNPDFHPTDILEDADGSFLLIDTGGWFRIGCPTSQIARPNILGAIYRVRKSNEQLTIGDPWGTKWRWEKFTTKQLVASLTDDPRHALRGRIEEQIAQRLATANSAEITALVEYLESEVKILRPDAGAAVVRSASKSRRKEALPILATAATVKDSAVRSAALYALGWHRDPQAVALLEECLTSDPLPAIKRVAAISLSQHKESSSVPRLLESLQVEQDPVLRHALTFALLEIGDPTATRSGLTSENPAVIAASLTSLDQMVRGHLTQAEVAQHLSHSHPLVQGAVLAILTRHPDWSDSLIQLAAQTLQKGELTDGDRQVILGAVQLFAAKPALQSVIAKGLSSDKAPATQLLLLEGLSQCEVPTLPDAWHAPLQNLLAGSNPELVRSTLVALKNLRAAVPLQQSLQQFVSQDRDDASLTLEAWSLLLAAGQPLTEKGFSQLIAPWQKESDPSDRLAAAQGLALAKLSAAQLLQLAPYAATASPLELPTLLSTFRQSQEAAVGLAIAASLNQAPAATGLSPAQLQESLQQYPPQVQTALAPLHAQLEAATKQQRENLQALSQSLPPEGDVRRGRDVFFGRKTACASCHQVGVEGGRVGPDLSDVGKRRARLDLLEAIAFPSASLVRGFESHTVLLEDGRVLSGILASQSSQSILLRKADQSQQRISREEITSLNPSATSIMPAGLEKTMTPAQLSDLLAYLQSLQGNPKR